MLDKNRIFYLVAFIAFTYFALNFFMTSYQRKVISANGSPVTVKVTGVPNCGRSSNTMDVKYKQKVYNINIGKNDCIEGRYKNGDKIEVLYSKEYDKMQLPSEKSNLLYWMSIIFFIIPLYFLIEIVKPFKK
jgi:hypothetical protein